MHGNYTEGLEEYKKTRKLRPESSLTDYHIGVTRARLGLYEDALVSLPKTLELEPNFRNRRELMEQVRALKGRK